MPWHIEERGDEYCVIKDSDDTVEGCHDTESEAEDQMAALYASEAERVGLIDWLRRATSPIRALFGLIDREWSGDASNYDSTSDYCSACLIDVNAAADNDEKVQSHCMLPVKSPGSDSVNWEAIQAAAGGHGIQAVEKPEGVSSEDWESAVKSAANKIISEYNSHDETAPDAVYELADKDPPEERMSEERVLSLELVFDQIYDQKWEDEDMSGAWIHDLYMGDGEPFLIMSRAGKLYKVPLSVTGDSVSLGDMEPVEIKFEATDRIATKTVIREVEPGVYRWFSISATSVLNKDGEIDSQELFDSFVEHVEETGEYPVRRFHHIQHDKFITGECDFVARDEHVLITSGLYNDSELAELEIKSREEDPDKWGESIGYLPTEPPELIRVSGVEIPQYNDGILREISTVEKENACSWFTTTTLKEEVTRMALTQRAKSALLKLFNEDEDAMEAFVGEVSLTNREIEDEDLISREESEEEELEDPEDVERDEDPEDVEEDPQEVILDDAALNAIAERFTAALDPLRERVDALEGRIDGEAETREKSGEDMAEVLNDLMDRVEELEKDDEKKLQERLDDASPRMRRTRVSYRPREERETDDEPQVPEYEERANETLAQMPQ